MNLSSETIKTTVVRLIKESLSSNFSASMEKEASSRPIETVNLIDDLGMDSVQILSLLMTLEEEFSIDLDEADVDLDKMMNVQSLIDFVSRKTSAAT
jgi:acyl carrier protein